MDMRSDTAVATNTHAAIGFAPGTFDTAGIRGFDNLITDGFIAKINCASTGRTASAAVVTGVDRMTARLAAYWRTSGVVAKLRAFIKC